MALEKSGAHDTTVVAPTAGERALYWAGFPPLGAAALWLLTRAADWVATLPWAPLQGPFELIASVPEPAATVGALLLGALAGLVLAWLADLDHVTATVDDQQVTLTHEGRDRTLRRAAVGAVFLDGKQLVLLGHRTEELARIKGDLDAARFAAAFGAHGYPWREDGDPHAAAYRRWVDGVPGVPDLPAGAAPLLTARGHALRKSRKDDAGQLRAELARLGVVVREEGKQQYWRSAHRPADGPEDAA